MLRAALIEDQARDLIACWKQYLDAEAMGSPERIEAAMERLSRRFRVLEAGLRR
jgi:hypothetical protein